MNHYKNKSPKVLKRRNENLLEGIVPLKLKIAKIDGRTENI